MACPKHIANTTMCVLHSLLLVSAAGGQLNVVPVVDGRGRRRSSSHAMALLRVALPLLLTHVVLPDVLNGIVIRTPIQMHW